MKALIQKSGMVVTLVLVVSYGVVALRGPNGIGALAEKRRQIRDLQEQNASLDAENKRKRDRIELLKTSRPAQELEIRERLKLVRPGETQFILPETPAETPAPVK
jgi:cell division protein FtsB